MTEMLLRTFNFEIELRRSPDLVSGAFGSSAAPADASSSGEQLAAGGFQECSGLEIELDIQELQEGGRNDGVIRRVGRAKYQAITLKRGMFFASESGAGGLDRALWQWLQGIASGVVPVPRYDGSIRVLDQGETIATWTFVRGLPSRLRGPELNAKTGEIAIEELQIAHEGLILEDA
ncbi:phage tail protein [Nannocystaceae bacterium ST9]